jgi:hypothetical protein
MNEIQELSARLAIRELIDRYTIGVSKRDWDCVKSCFDGDARWHTSIGHDFQGQEAIVSGIRAVVEARKFLIQMTHGMTIDQLAGDSAQTTSILHEFATGEAIFVLGSYHDKLIRTDGVWRFKERFFQVHYVDTTPLPGTVMVDYATLR